MSGQQIGTVVGGAIGGIFFGNFAAGAAFGGFLGSLADTIPGRQLGAPQQQQYRDGAPITLGWGTFVTAGTVFDQGQVRKVTRRTRQGKGGPRIENDSFIQTFAVLFAEAIDARVGFAGVTRIWENERLVYDVRPESTIQQESQRYAEGITIYLGTDDQQPDPELEAIHGAGNVPAYKGRLYIVWRDKDLTDYGGAIPQFRIEIASVATVIEQPEWAAVLSGNERLAISPNGIDWPGSLSQVSGIPDFDIATDGNRIVTMGQFQSASTSDLGQTWTLSPSTFGGNGAAIAYGGGRFYAVRNLSGPIYSSVDGISWSPSETTVPAIYAIAARASTSIAVAFGSVYRSSDFGTNYAQVFTDFTGGTGAEVGASLTHFIVHAFDDGDSVFLVSTNGIAWEKYTAPWTDFDSGGSTRRIVNVSGSIWVAGIGDSSGGWQVARSDDNGQTWTVTASSAVTVLRDIASDGVNVVIATGNVEANAATRYSADGGLTWTSPQLSTNLIQRFVPITDRLQDTVVSGEANLAAIVADISNRTRIPESQRIVSALASIDVRGLALNNVGSHGENVAALMDLYQFDAPEYDGAIRFERRGGPVTLSIPLDDLIDDGTTLELMRDEQRGFPKSVHVHYQSQETDYSAAKQTASRRSNAVNVVGEISVQSLVNEDHVFHARLADISIRQAWTEAEGKVEFRLPINYLATRPGQKIALPIAGKLTAFRITRWNYDDGEIFVEAYRYRQSDYTSNVTGVPALPVTPPPPSIAGPTRFAWLNLPALNEDQDDTGYSVGMGPILPGWFGADLERSLDGGQSWVDVDSTTLQATVGVLTQGVPAGQANMIDTYNTIRVQLPNGQSLDTVSDSALQQRANAAAIRSNADDEPEIIQFRDAVNEGNGVWALTYLPRGQLNTPSKSWPAGSVFTLLEDSRFVREPIGVIGQSIVLRPVSFTESPEDSTQYPETFAPVRAQQEWAPLDLVAIRDGGNLSLSVTPRWRLGTDLNPIRSADFDGWRWVVDSVVYTTSGPSLTIPDPGPDVPVSVAGINRVTGPGLALEEIA